MRVITGVARGRRLRSVHGRSIRPTADRVKEALFSMLESRFDLVDRELLDLFAGSGALGIEALSRGARCVTFVERDAATRRILEQNLRACGLLASAVIIGRSTKVVLRERAVAELSVDGVFLDPPYRLGLLPATLSQLGAGGLVARGGWVAAEYHVDEGPGERYGVLRLTVSRRYGKTGLALFTVAAAT